MKKLQTNFRRNPFKLLLAALLLFGSVGFVSETQLALTDLVKQMVTAQTNFDTATLEKIYASDYIEVSPVGEVDAREKAIGFYKHEANPDRDKTKTSVNAADFLIRSFKDFAVVIARFTFKQSGTESSAARPPVSFRATLFCRKEKRRWKIGSVQATGVRLPRPQSSK